MSVPSGSIYLNTQVHLSLRRLLLLQVDRWVVPLLAEGELDDNGHHDKRDWMTDPLPVMSVLALWDVGQELPASGPEI